MSYVRVAAVGMALLAGASSAFAQTAGDPAAGQRLAERTCFSCHGSETAAKKAPSFSAVAAMPSTTTKSLGVFLQTSHPTMPNLILTATERDDVIAYILSLR